MNIKIAFLGISLLLVSLISCKKSNNSSSSSANLIRTYTEDITSSSTGHTVTVYNVSYDGSNRISALTDASGAGNKQVYGYGTNNFTLDIYIANVLNIHETFMLNSIPFVDSTLQYDNSGDTSTEKYLYNSSKQLMEQDDYDFSSVYGNSLTDVHTYSYYSDGNPMTDNDYNGTTSYSYYDSLPYVARPGIADELYFPVPNKLIKSVTISNGGNISIINYTYSFDSNKRLSTQKETADNGDVVLKTYTY